MFGQTFFLNPPSQVSKERSEMSSLPHLHIPQKLLCFKASSLAFMDTSPNPSRHVDPPSCWLHRSSAWLWIPYPSHRYIYSLQWPLLHPYPHLISSSSSSSINHPRQTQSKLILHPYNVASGLYYLSELVEEHTVFARKLLTRLIYAIIAIQTLLTLIDRFPLVLSLVSIASHGVYMGNLRHFPIVKLTDPVFLLSCGKPPPLPPSSLPSSLPRLLQTNRNKNSPCSREPLALVPPLLCTPIALVIISLSIIHLRPSRDAHLYGNRFLLRYLRLASPVRPLRIAERG